MGGDIITHDGTKLSVGPVAAHITFVKDFQLTIDFILIKCEKLNYDVFLIVA